MREREKMQRSDYKSSFHYLALQPGHSGLSFDEFLLYFSNKDIGKLDLAISETILRDAFHKRLPYFYQYNSIACLDEFKMIANRRLGLKRCKAPNMSISKIPTVMLSYIVNSCLRCYRQREYSAGTLSDTSK